MHSLPCQHCDKSITVSAAKAGQQVACPHCDHQVTVPRLGDLKKLPLAGDAGSDAGGKIVQDQSLGGASAGRSIVFILGALLATACLLIAGYCGIRWYLIDVPSTTHDHIAQMKAAYEKAPAASLILEYENMEKYGVEAAGPYQYQVIANTKADWGFNALVAAAVGIVALTGAAFAASRR